MSDPYKLGNGFKGVSSHYGWRLHPKTNQPEFHPGSDFSAPEGTPIPSAAPGVVVYSGKNEGDMETPSSSRTIPATIAFMLTCEVTTRSGQVSAFGKETPSV